MALPALLGYVKALLYALKPYGGDGIVDNLKTPALLVVATAAHLTGYGPAYADCILSSLFAGSAGFDAAHFEE